MNLFFKDMVPRANLMLLVSWYYVKPQAWP